MTNAQQGFIAGLSLGSFISMLLILFSIICIPTLPVVMLASVGVFMGAFSGCLVTFTWASFPSASAALVYLEA